MIIAVLSAVVRVARSDMAERAGDQVSRESLVVSSDLFKNLHGFVFAPIHTPTSCDYPQPP